MGSIALSQIKTNNKPILSLDEGIKVEEDHYVRAGKVLSYAHELGCGYSHEISPIDDVVFCASCFYNSIRSAILAITRGIVCDNFSNLDFGKLNNIDYCLDRYYSLFIKAESLIQRKYFLRIFSFRNIVMYNPLVILQRDITPDELKEYTWFGMRRQYERYKQQRVFWEKFIGKNI